MTRDTGGHRAGDAFCGGQLARGKDRYRRSPERIARFFDGLEPVEPGTVSVSLWRPDQSPSGALPQEVDDFGGVARKP